MKIINLCILSVLLVSCHAPQVDVRPITRSEYGRNTFYSTSPRSDFTTEYGYVEGGARVQIEKASIDLMVGPQAAWSDSQDPTAGANVNPRFFYFFDKDTFLHLETDITFYEGGSENMFTLFAIEKVW